MKFLALSLSAALLFSAVSAKAPGYCPPKDSTKSQVCQAFAAVGLANINLLGCNLGDLKGSANIQRRALRHSRRMHKIKRHPGCDRDPEQLCQQLATLGLVNLNLLGCDKLTVDPTVNIGSPLMPKPRDMLSGAGPSSALAEVQDTLANMESNDPMSELQDTLENAQSNDPMTEAQDILSEVQSSDVLPQGQAALSSLKGSSVLPMARDVLAIIERQL